MDGAPLDPTLVDPEGVDAPDLVPVDPDPAVPGVDPTLVDPALTDPALTDPSLTDPALVDPTLVDPALVLVTTLPVDPMAVSATLLDVDPVLCSDPGYVPVAATQTAAAQTRDSTVDPPMRIGAEPARTAPTPVPSGGSATQVPVEGQGEPPAPTAPPSPARLPAPLPAPSPAGPAGCPTSAASGACCFGPGQTDHADGVDAVLEARVTASLAQAGVRPTSGFAGAVVGGADDPGVRPG